jgi:hypothetical protein
VAPEERESDHQLEAAMAPDRRLGSLLLAMFLIGLALTGCAPGTPKDVSLPDSTGSFHILVPASWQHDLASGYIGLYASDSLPSGGAGSALSGAPSMIILTTTTTSTTPVPTELTTLIDIRAAARGWRTKTVGSPRSTMVGNRPGYSADVSGVDGSGAKFSGRFYVARTSDREVFIAALATPQAWPGFEPQVSDVLRHWYWQLTNNTAQLPGTGVSEAAGHPTGVNGPSHAHRK